MLRRRVSMALGLLAGVAAAALAAAPAAPAAAGAAAFPKGFLWGTANAGFQYEMGGARPHVDRGTDWFAWTHDAANIAAKRVTADRPERSAGHWSVYAKDIALAKGLGSNAYRLGVEWSRIFPRSTAAVRTGSSVTLAQLRALDRLADQAAVRHYRDELAAIRARRMTVFLTVNHFTLPSWIHDPVATRDAFAGRAPDAPLPAGLQRSGWLDPATVGEFRKLSAYLAWKFGGLVDHWTPLNEPMVVATNGFVNVPGAFAGYFPPGIFSYTAAVAAIQNLQLANAASYDAIKARDRSDADGDGVRAQVGLVQNLIAFTPASPGKAADRAAVQHADYLFNRLFLDSAVKGIVDANGNGVIDPGERRPALRGKADFIGVNYYFRGRVASLGSALSTRIPILDFLPATGYRTPLNPAGAPCPSECSDFGSEIYPEGFGAVLRTAGSYGKPIYITENGIADAADSRRLRFTVQHLLQVRRAIRTKAADIRGYFHWSLIDNFEWSSGYLPKFGLYRFDPRTLKRLPRPSAASIRQIFSKNALSAALVRRFG
jgi:beta-galactosidase